MCIITSPLQVAWANASLRLEEDLPQLPQEPASGVFHEDPAEAGYSATAQQGSSDVALDKAVLHAAVKAAKEGHSRPRAPPQKRSNGSNSGNITAVFDSACSHGNGLSDAGVGSRPRQPLCKCTNAYNCGCRVRHPNPQVLQLLTCPPTKPLRHSSVRGRRNGLCTFGPFGFHNMHSATPRDLIAAAAVAPTQKPHLLRSCQIKIHWFLYPQITAQLLTSKSACVPDPRATLIPMSAVMSAV